MADSAVERAYAAPWSEELMCAVSQEDNALDTLLDEANQFDWLRNEDEVIVENPPEKVAASAFLFHRACDDDSVSTFRTKKSRPPAIDTPCKKYKIVTSTDVEMTSNQPILPNPTTPEMENIQQLETPLLNTSGLSGQSGHTYPVTPLNTGDTGPPLQNRQALKEGTEPSDHNSESEVSL